MQVAYTKTRKVFRIGTVRYNWPMSAHASQAFSIAHCTDSEDLPKDDILARFRVRIRVLGFRTDYSKILDAFMISLYTSIFVVKTTIKQTK